MTTTNLYADFGMAEPPNPWAAMMNAQGQMMSSGAAANSDPYYNQLGGQVGSSFVVFTGGGGGGRYEQY